MLTWWRGDTVPEMRETLRGRRDHAGLWNWKIRRQPCCDSSAASSSPSPAATSRTAMPGRYGGAATADETPR